jgi:hypothetical protein
MSASIALASSDGKAILIVITVPFLDHYFPANYILVLKEGVSKGSLQLFAGKM